MSYAALVDQDCRLVILRLLAEETDATLNEAILHRAVEPYGHRRSRDYIKSQIRWLGDVGAVAIAETGDFLIATLTSKGADHVERRVVIDGVSRPSLSGT